MANVDDHYCRPRASSDDGSRPDDLASTAATSSPAAHKPAFVQQTNFWIKGLLQWAPVRHFDSLLRRNGHGSSVNKGQIAKSPPSQRPWRPSVLRFGPLSGILGMVLALCCICASLGILAGSNDQAVSEWSVPPSTLLAIFTAIANLSMRYAALQGVVIAWWVRAMKGCTLAKLHWDWRSGTTLKGALTAGRHMGLLGLACLFSVVVVVDGPLLQRATTIRPASIAGGPRMTLLVKMAPEVPRGLTGQWNEPAKAANRMPQSAMFNATIPGPNGPVSNHINTASYEGLTQSFSVIGQWLRGSPVHHTVRGCAGKCKAKIQAPALFATECKTHLLPVNYTSLPSANEMYDVGKGTAPPIRNQAFAIASALDVSGEHEALILYTGYATLEHCRGIYNYTTCRLESGIGEYEVDIVGNQTILAKPIVPKYVAVARNTLVERPSPGQPYAKSTLASLKQAMIGHWESAVIYSDERKDHGYSVQYGNTYEAFQGSSDNGWCYSWQDPREQVLASLNSLMFYYGAHAAHEDPAYLATRMDPGLVVNTTVTGFGTGEHDVFQTEYLWFMRAAIVEIVCIGLVAPTYWGWWTIGRPVSFSPLEVAKAFSSPMMSECDSNSSSRDLAEAVGDIRVKYGSVKKNTEGEETRTTFDDPETAEHPEKGMRFGV